MTEVLGALAIAFVLAVGLAGAGGVLLFWIGGLAVAIALVVLIVVIEFMVARISDALPPRVRS